MVIAAHWKVFDKTGAEIDDIENTLRKITGVAVTRTETATVNEKYVATYVLTGDIEAQRLVDACEFMKDVDAYPV